MAEYTKGKWEVTKHPPLNNPRIVIKGDKPYNDEAIALIEACPEAEGNAQLIVSAANLCISINPENPLAVAEGMGRFIKVCRKELGGTDVDQDNLNKVLDALASIERGK